MMTATRWDRLVAWLGAHGVDATALSQAIHCRHTDRSGNGLYAAKAIPPATELLTIPPSALLNSATLPPLPTLNAVQRISLHLLLHRPDRDGLSTDPLFGTYIATLPPHFDPHPLFCLLYPPDPRQSPSTLLQHLPPSVARDLLHLKHRFHTDYRVVSRFLAAHPKLLSSLPLAPSFDPQDFQKDYLWAWLNVNTRCIYYQIKPNQLDPNNITMCPVLDMANHRAEQTHLHATPHHRSRNPSAAAGLSFTSPSEHAVPAGEQLFLRYGAHSNRTLFVEYGFVDLDRSAALAEVDVQDLLEQRMFGHSSSADWLKQSLQDNNYWGDWSIFPDGPSFRLISALRLLCLSHRLEPHATAEERDAVLDAWQATILGTADSISDENEEAWRHVLRALCAQVAERGREKLRELLSRAENKPDIPDEHVSGLLGHHVQALWDEEIAVAVSVIQKLDRGEKIHA